MHCIRRKVGIPILENLTEDLHIYIFKCLATISAVTGIMSKQINIFGKQFWNQKKLYLT